MINSQNLRLVITIMVLSIGLPAGLPAQAPNLVSYSGTLTDAQGVPTEAPLNLTFRIYDHPLEGPPPRQPLYTQTINQVPVRKGQFTVQLGPFSNNVFSQGSGERYVEVQVGTEPPLLPRQRLIGVPYALRTGSIDGAAGGSIRGGLNVSGNIGIGTTTPGQPLHISRGGAGSATDVQLDNTDTGGISWSLSSVGNIPGRVGNFEIKRPNVGVQFSITPNGNVGIGTTSPTAKLHVVAAAGQHVIFDAGGDGTRMRFPQGGAIGTWSGIPGQYVVTLGTGADDASLAGDRLYVKNATGNVGIGTTTPQAKLDVNGDIRGRLKYTEEYATGDPAPLRLIHSNQGFCFLTQAGGAGAVIYIDRGDGYWYLRALGGSYAMARCAGII